MGRETLVLGHLLSHGGHKMYFTFFLPPFKILLWLSLGPFAEFIILFSEEEGKTDIYHLVLTESLHIYS